MTAEVRYAMRCNLSSEQVQRCFDREKKNLHTQISGRAQLRLHTARMLIVNITIKLYALHRENSALCDWKFGSDNEPHRITMQLP